MPARLTRRHAVQLAVAITGGWAVGTLLHRAAPVGRELPASDTLTAILGDDAPATGPATASIRLAVFSDYRCPACRHAFPALEAAVAADGDVRVIHRDWPIFGAASELAARTALASARQGRYAAVHRRLMRDGRTIDDATLRDIVVAAGADWERVVADRITHAAAIAAQLARNARLAGSIGLPGTPGYLAGRMLVVGAIDQRAFARLFAAARDGAPRRP